MKSLTSDIAKVFWPCFGRAKRRCDFSLPYPVILFHTFHHLQQTVVHFLEVLILFQTNKNNIK